MADDVLSGEQPAKVVNGIQMYVRIKFKPTDGTNQIYADPTGGKNGLLVTGSQELFQQKVCPFQMVYKR